MPSANLFDEISLHVCKRAPHRERASDCTSRRWTAPRHGTTCTRSLSTLNDSSPRAQNHCSRARQSSGVRALARTAGQRDTCVSVTVISLVFRFVSHTLRPLHHQTHPPSQHPSPLPLLSCPVLSYPISPCIPAPQLYSSNQSLLRPAVHPSTSTTASRRPPCDARLPLASAPPTGVRTRGAVSDGNETPSCEDACSSSLERGCGCLRGLGGWGNGWMGRVGAAFGGRVGGALFAALPASRAGVVSGTESATGRHQQGGPQKFASRQHRQSRVSE